MTTQDNIKNWKIDTRWGKIKYKWLKSHYSIFNVWDNYREKSFRYAAEWMEIYRTKYNSSNFIVMEDPLYFAPFVNSIKQNYNLPLVVFIQNIESLGSENIDSKRRMDFCEFEIELLKKTDLCITISREETFLLKNLGINVYYFPYYPSEETANHLLDIRKKRQITNKKDILFIGTVHNPPTGAGLKSLIDAWGEHELYLTDHTFLIAGYGTETYASYAKDVSGIKFLGSVNDRTLDNLLSEVSCSIVYQTTGSGALTKITEMLIANVPIVANSHAIRNYYNIPGIYEFVTFDEMAHIIKDSKFGLMDSIIPDKPDGSKLIDAIKKTIKMKK